MYRPTVRNPPPLARIEPLELNIPTPPSTYGDGWGINVKLAVKLRGVRRRVRTHSGATSYAATLFCPQYGRDRGSNRFGLLSRRCFRAALAPRTLSRRSCPGCLRGRSNCPRAQRRGQNYPGCHDRRLAVAAQTGQYGILSAQATLALHSHTVFCSQSLLCPRASRSGV